MTINFMARLHAHNSKTKFFFTVVLLLLCGVYYFFLRAAPLDSTVLTETIKRGDIENAIAATGKLEPKQYVELGAQVSGQIQKIYVEEGEAVQAGQLLLEIDATVFETKVQNVEASLEGKRAQLQQLQAELELAQLRAKRNQKLHAKKAVSEDSLFESLANEKILHAKIRAMKAQIKADAASLVGDKATLGYAKIYAPITGTVVNLSVREGQTLNANQNAPLLLKIADLSVLTLRAEVSEADIIRLRKNMPVYFKTFGGGARRWHSTLRQVLPTPSIVNNVVLYQALIDVVNTDGQLMDAMTTQVFFIKGRAEDVLIIPLSALTFAQQRRDNVQTEKGSRKSTSGAQSGTVMKQTDAGLVRVKVSVGVRNRTHAQLLSGLNAGDVVAIGSQSQRSNGANNSLLGGAPKGGRRGF